MQVEDKEDREADSEGRQAMEGFWTGEVVEDEAEKNEPRKGL